MSTSSSTLSSSRAAVPQLDAPSPSPIALPSAVVQRFFTEFTSRIQAQSSPATTSRFSPSSLSKKPTSETVEDDEETALQRLSSAQAAALPPLLWQWLLILSNRQKPSVTESSDNTEVDAPRTRAPLPQSCRNEHARTGVLHTPAEVENMFQMSFRSSLVPSSDEASFCTSSRRCLSESPAPWHHDTASTASPSSLVGALVQLSSYGPLFSSWCSLFYFCTSASVQNADESKVGDAIGQLRDAWRAAAAAAAAAAVSNARGDSQLGKRNATVGTDNDREDGMLDKEAMLQLWLRVYSTNAKSAQAGESASAPLTPTSTTPPAAFTLVAAQFYYECCRVAAGGREDTFTTQWVAPFLVTRVVDYLCLRLSEELQRIKDSRSATSGRCSLAANIKEEEEEREETTSSCPSSRHQLRIATLSGMALQAPAVAAASSAHAGRRAAPKRAKNGKRARSSNSISSDDVFLMNTEMAEDGDKFGVVANSSRTSHGSAFQLFLARGEQAMSVPIASSLLTVYTLTEASAETCEENKPSRCADGKPGEVGIAALPPTREEKRGAKNEVGEGRGVLDAPASLSLEREIYLRSGKVLWWTLGDSQRHRQLMAERSLP